MFHYTRSFAPRALATLALTLGVLACVGSPARADGPAPDHKTAQFEVHFLRGMINHHHMAVMMAELIPDRAVHKELVALGEAIIEAQTAEIAQMQSWLHDWYGIQHQPHLDHHMQQQLHHLSMLHDEEFEIFFMAMMIEHHVEAIMDALECIDRAYHKEMVKMCMDIVETQSMEIEQMLAWLCKWYDICP